MTPLGPCPICNSAETRRLVRWQRGYSICDCGGCGVLFSDPLPSPEQLQAFYQGFLYKKPSQKQLRAQIDRRVSELRGLLEIEQCAGLRLLDHGGGTGLTYAAASRLGFDTYFNDIDQASIELVKAQHGLDDAHLVADLTSTSHRFDVIVSDNVIEHVPDPVALLCQLVALLAPGGTLVIKTPYARANEQFFYPRTIANYVALAARGGGGTRAALRMPLRAPVWCCDPPRHLFGFTPASLTAAACAAAVPETWCSSDSYGAPLFSGTFLETYVKRPDGPLGLAKRALVAPLLGPELALKGVHLALRKLGALTPMGLVFRITRPTEGQALSASAP